MNHWTGQYQSYDWFVSGQNKTVKDRFTEQALEEGRLKSPEDLNEQYKDLGLKFDAPTSQEEAKLLAKGKLEF